MNVQGKVIGYILPQLINILLAAFPEETIKRALDSVIDALENQIARSETKVDDMALPVIKMLRGVFSIPDYQD